MNIQIFGKAKCFDTKKTQRYFKERGIRFQNVDLKVKAMSKGELKSVASALGGIDALVDEKADGAAVVRYLAYDEDKLDKLAAHPEYLKTPVVRNGRLATVGYRPEVWKAWD